MIVLKETLEQEVSEIKNYFATSDELRKEFLDQLANRLKKISDHTSQLNEQIVLYQTVAENEIKKNCSEQIRQTRRLEEDLANFEESDAKEAFVEEYRETRENFNLSQKRLEDCKNRTIGQMLEPSTFKKKPDNKFFDYIQ